MDELHVGNAAQFLPQHLDQVRIGLHRDHPGSPRRQCRRQCPQASADLKDRVLIRDGSTPDDPPEGCGIDEEILSQGLAWAQAIPTEQRARIIHGVLTAPDS